MHKPGASYCEGTTFLTYEPVGKCENGGCSYSVSAEECVVGCSESGCDPVTELVCGNAVLDGSEDCDDGNADTTDSCLPDCTFAFCGDSYINLSTEECDDGGTIPGDGCDQACVIEEPPADSVCGNGVQEGTENCTSCPSDASCGTSGSICIAGTCEACGANGQPCCAGSTPCFEGECQADSQYCQVVNVVRVWSTDFEESSWLPTEGQIELPNGIQVWDQGGPSLLTEPVAGNPGQALAWYGGGISYDYFAAQIGLPVILDHARGITLTMDLFLSSDGPGDITIYAERGSCVPAAITVINGGWRVNVTRSIAPCSDGTGLIIYVGEVYQFPENAIALRIDNIKVDYQ